MTMKQCNVFVNPL